MWTVEFAGKFRMQTGTKGGIHTGLYSLWEIPWDNNRFCAPTLTKNSL